ncbi:MAG: peptidyl-prolyl cis-trans isomerase [Thermoanaerobaculia bacterium]|nr:peptidyl-prolyl cis-trans isomerase [Thermoanaerobaculia bacterium]
MLTPQASSLQDEIVLARFDGGTVTLLDLAPSAAPPQGGTSEITGTQQPSLEQQASCRNEIETIALDHYLAAQFNPEEEPRFEEWSRVLRWDVEVLALEKALRTDAEPTDEGIEAALASSPLAKPTPKRWQLRSLFRRVEPSASEEERSLALQLMNELRQRIEKGEDFSALALQYSESSNRLRGGKIGWVRAEDLAPPVATAVARLETGQVTPPIEVADGLTMVQLLGVLPEQPPDLDLARRRVRGRLQREALEQQHSALRTRLLDEARVTYSKTSDPAHSKSLARYRVSETTSSVSEEALQAYLQFRRNYRPLAELPADRLRFFLDERILLELEASEARRRHLVDKNSERDLERDLQALRASSALSVLVERRVTTPEPAKIAAYYAEHVDQLGRAKTVYVRALEAPADGSQPRTFYERMRQVGLQAQAGEATFEEAATALGSGATIRDLGWLTDDQMWMLGPAPFDALQELEVGQVTATVQEGRRLLILQARDIRASSTPSLEEAREQISVILRNQQRAQLRRVLREELRRTARIELTPQGEARCGVDPS